VFKNDTKIIFGRGSESKVGNEIKKFGNKILLHYGGKSIKKSGLYESVIKYIKDSGLDLIDFGGVQPNPRLKLVKKGIEICRREKVDFILAVGGGSVIDSAKAISIGTPYSGDVWDFFSGKAEVENNIPLGVILTIPAAGSESSNGLVITNETGLYKRAYSTEILRPKFAILNPEISFTLSNYQTAIGAADIMAHVMERYFTNIENVDFTDRLCEATLKTIINNTLIVLAEPENYNARAEIMWAGTIAHNDLLSTGRVGDWGSHNIEHELSGVYDISHGEGLAIIIPAWMEYVYKNDIERFAQFAERVWSVEPDFRDLEKTAIEGIEKMKEYFSQIGLPTSLEESGIDDKKFEEMAAKSTESGPLGNFIKLNKDDVLNILMIAK